MIKKILLYGLVACVLVFATLFARRSYYRYLEKVGYEEFLANIKPSAADNVTVLQDSFHIDYQDDKRTVHYLLPKNYDRDTSVRYPVIYMMDGGSAFDEMVCKCPEWRIDEVVNAAAETDGPQAIVITINSAEDRDAEYTPWVNDDTPEAHGEAYTNWFADEFKQWADTTFRTRPEAEFTTIGGISRSGMKAYYMLMRRPDVFGNALIQSPAMWVDEERLLAMTLTEEQLQEKKIFVSVGSYEGRVMIPNAEAIYEKFSALGLGEDRLQYFLVENEGHSDMTWRKSFARAWPWVMAEG